MTSGTPFIEMRGIVKEFPGVRALNDVSLEVRPGEVHVLLGENGAGKSTLIKVLSGVYAPDRGEIRIDGQPVRLRSPHDAQRLGITTIFQEFNLAPDLTVAANVFLGREPTRRGLAGVLDRRKLLDETRAVLAALDFQIAPDAVVKRLGVAEQQMVEIAKALSQRARLIVMDEPTATLSTREIEHLFKTIRDLRRQGVSIIYISHRLDEVKALGDRATILRDGAVVGSVEVGDTTTDTLVRMMVGRDLKDKFPKVRVAPGEEALRVEHLTRTGLFHDVSFHVRRGEVLGIAGLVGSKRTETVRAVFGADPHDEGRILIHGRPVPIASPADAIRNHIALVPEDRKRQGILPSLSVKANITLSALPQFSRWGVLDVRRERARAQELVSSLRIAVPNLERWVHFLSGGNQQKVVIAKWMITKADVFLFDEPTRGIDVGAKVDVYQLMGELVRRGAAIVMISSELPDILGMSDRILVMHEGRVSGEFTSADATEEKILDCALRGARHTAA
jgi:ribose transport system ATP-binding protein